MGMRRVVELVLVRGRLAFLAGVLKCDHTGNRLVKVVEDDDLSQVRELAFDLEDFVHVFPGAHETHLGVGILDDVPGLFCGVGRIDRYIHRTHGDDGQVGHPPFIAVRREEGHLVAGLDISC